MGQATVDLPDPLQAALTPAGPNADDLLAQMAGEDIDRLLAEAENGAPAIPLQSSAAEADTGEFAPRVGGGSEESNVGAEKRSGDTSPGELDDLLNALTTAPRSASAQVSTPPAVDAPTTPPPSTTESSDDSAGVEKAERDALADEEVDAELAAEAAALLAATSSTHSRTTATVEEVSSSVDAAERSALVQDQPPATAESPSEPPAAVGEVAVAAAESSAAEAGVNDGAMEETEDDQTVPLPIFLRPLEWLSAPLADSPDLLRDIIGKIALMTVVNALAVLGYVLFIRRH